MIVWAGIRSSMLTEGKSRMVKPLVAWYLCSALYLVVKFTANGKLISGGKEGCPDEVLSVSVGVAVGGLIIGAIQIAVLSCARGRRRCDELGMWEEGKLEDGYLALPPSPTDSFRSAASALTFSSSRNSSEFDEYSGSLEHQEQGTSRKTEILRKEREDIFNELANSFDPPNMKEASEMFLNTIKWRAEYGVDDLLKEGYNFPEYAAVQEHYPQGYHGVDIEGRPVNIQLVGELNVAKLMQPELRVAMLVLPELRVTRLVLPELQVARLVLPEPWVVRLALPELRVVKLVLPESR
eukprot:gene25192-30748_t